MANKGLVPAPGSSSLSHPWANSAYFSLFLECSGKRKGIASGPSSLVGSSRAIVGFSPRTQHLCHKNWGNIYFPETHCQPQMKTLDSVLKSRDYFANKGPSSQAYGFPSSHVQTWELDCEESPACALLAWSRAAGHRLLPARALLAWSRAAPSTCTPVLVTGCSSTRAPRLVTGCSSRAAPSTRALHLFLWLFQMSLLQPFTHGLTAPPQEMMEGKSKAPAVSFQAEGFLQESPFFRFSLVRASEYPWFPRGQGPINNAIQLGQNTPSQMSCNNNNNGNHNSGVLGPVLST